MNISRKAKHLAIVGRSGTGKTTLGITQILGQPHERVIIADHEGEFSERLKVPLCTDWKEFYDQLETQRIICLDITEVNPGETLETFDELAQSTLDLAKGVFDPKGMNCLFVIDEVQKYTSTASVPEGFKTLMETGRKWGIDTLSISQRPNKIHGDLLEQFTEIFFFQLKNPRSHIFGEYYGISAEEQMNLREGEYLYLNQRTDRRARGRLWEGDKGKIALSSVMEENGARGDLA